MIVAQKDTVGKTDSFHLPQSSYRARVVKSEFGESASRNPMTTLSCEIIEPERITVDGEEKVVASRTFKLYLVHVPHLVGQQPISSQAQVFEFMERLEVADLMEKDDNGKYLYNTALHKEYFLGCEFDIILSSQERIKRMRPDKTKGEKQGQPILDGEGNQIKDGWQIQANISDVQENARPTRIDMPF